MQLPRPNLTAHSIVVTPMLMAALRYLAFLAAWLLIPAPGWCCLVLAPASTSSQSCDQQQCPCRPSGKDSQTPSSPPTHPIPIKYCCCQPDSSKPPTAPSLPELGLPSALLIKCTSHRSTHIEWTDSRINSNASPPLQILHCVWTC
jgi:hypothetical protein